MTYLCVSLTEKTTEQALAAMRSLPSEVQMVEVRLDAMESFELNRICSAKDRPIIVTNRPSREGGGWNGDEQKRLETLREAARAGADYVDVELDAAAALGELPPGVRRIVSYHNFERTPADLEKVLRAIRAAGADVAKIAVRATDICDVPRVLSLLARHAHEGPLIALTMGEEGVAGRVLGAKFGAFLTFASLDEDARSAPGQVPWQQMLQMYRLPRIGPRTQVFGVMANPVGHSMSPPIHNAAFAARDLDAVYLPLKVSEPGAFLESFRPWGLRGLSVAIPHKEAMLGLMDEVDELARDVGAVNTVLIDGCRLRGWNTDVGAAVNAIERAARRAGLGPASARTVLIVGAGGGARAIAFGLKRLGCRLIIANRTVSRAQALAADVGGSARGLDELEGLEPNVLVNATSVGMWPKVDATPVPHSLLRAGMVVFDAIYNPIRTRLLREAEQAGAKAASGVEWFVNQAVEQFEIWTGTRAPRELMEQELRTRLSEQQSSLSARAPDAAH